MTSTALIDDCMDDLKQMLGDARRTADTWSDFLDAFVDYEELIARIKAKSLR